MKISKLILLTIFSLSLFTCSSDDSDDDNQTVTKVIPDTSIEDVDAILALPPDSDITNLISFGQPNGVSTADHESVVEKNDRFVLDKPEGLLPTDVFVYQNIYFYDELDTEVPFEDGMDQYLKLVIPSGESNSYYDNNPTKVIFKTIYVDDYDLNVKYDIECTITRDGTVYGPYIIDPKLRIKGSNTLN